MEREMNLKSCSLVGRNEGQTKFAVSINMRQMYTTCPMVASRSETP